MLHYILESSGLSLTQIARCFNTAPRTVLSWSHNGVPNKHTNAVQHMFEVVSKLPADTAFERRSLLLDSSHGKSIFHTLCEQAPKDQQIQFPTPATQQLGLG